MRLLYINRNLGDLDFNLGTGKKDLSKVGGELTDEQQAELERVANEEIEKKKKGQNLTKTAEEIKAEEDALKEKEKEKKDGESDEDYQTRLKALEGEDNSAEDESNVINIFATEFGKVEGIEQIPESIDGIKDYFKKLIPEIEKKAAEAALIADPRVASFHKHLSEGKSVETFMARQTATDYSKIKIDKDTTKETLESLIAQDLAAMGVNKETIDLVITAAGDKDILDAKAKESLKNLKTRQEEALRQKEEKEILNAKAEQEAIIEEEKKVKGIVTSGTLLGLNIPKEDRDALLDFIYKPVEGNKSRRDIVNESLTLEQLLYIDYLIMKGKLKSVSTNSKVKTIEQLKEESDRLKKANLTNSHGSGKTPGKGVPSIQELTGRN